MKHKAQNVQVRARCCSARLTEGLLSLGRWAWFFLLGIKYLNKAKTPPLLVALVAFSSVLDFFSAISDSMQLPSIVG